MHTAAPSPLRRIRPLGSAAHGITLIEMMTAVVMMAVLLAVAVPGLAAFVRSSRVNAAQSELVSSMMLARSEAAKRGHDVQLVAATGTAPADFSGGWLVGWDADGDGGIDTSASSAEVIRSYPAPGGGIVVKAPDPLTPAPKFAATGFLSPATRIAFDVCDPDNRSRGYRVSLEPVGLADITSPSTCP